MKHLIIFRQISSMDEASNESNGVILACWKNHGICHEGYNFINVLGITMIKRKIRQNIIIQYGLHRSDLGDYFALNLAKYSRVML